MAHRIATRDFDNLTPDNPTWVTLAQAVIEDPDEPAGSVKTLQAAIGQRIFRVGKLHVSSPKTVYKGTDLETACGFYNGLG